MKRLTLALLALGFLAVDTVALPSVPEDKEAPPELTDWKYGNSRHPDPGSACLNLTLQHYHLVLTDPENRADHFYLAQTYQFLAENKATC